MHRTARRTEGPEFELQTPLAVIPDSSRRGVERRHERRLFVLRERRTGFDRRDHYAFTGSLREPLRLFGVLLIVNMLSILDFVFTYHELSNGLASEANPVMASSFESGPAGAWLFKTLVMFAITLAIWRGRAYRRILGVALLALILYLAVTAYHLVGISQVT